MAQDAVMVCEAEPENASRLAEGDLICFVRTSDGRGVFKYKKNATQQYDNGYLIAVIKGDDAIPMALSLSSILAPYGKEKPFCKDELKNLNKGFDTLAKRTYNALKGVIVKVAKTATVQFTAKSGKTIDWTCVELVETKKTFAPTDEQVADFDTFVEEYTTKQTKKLQE